MFEYRQLSHLYLWLVQSLAQALMNKVLFIVLSHYFQVLCLLVHARYISRYILTHRKVKTFFLSSFLFLHNGIQIFHKKYSNFCTLKKIILRGTKEYLGSWSENCFFSSKAPVIVLFRFSFSKFIVFTNINSSCK